MRAAGDKSALEFRRRGKEWRERIAAAFLLVAALPVYVACAAAIKLEGLLDEEARGPVLLKESRISRGRVFTLYKFRTITASATAELGGDMHIALQEIAGRYTKTGRILHQWYLDEVPQLWNIVRGDMFLIGTRPWPLQIYEKELAKGITRKRDMPAGLIGATQSRKGDPTSPGSLALDEQYWEAFKTYSGWQLFLLDLRIIVRSAKVQLEHKGL